MQDEETQYQEMIEDHRRVNRLLGIKKHRRVNSHIPDFNRDISTARILDYLVAGKDQPKEVR